MSHKYILAGECALSENGIITLGGGLVQVWTLYHMTPITEGVTTAYYWNPYADKPFLTNERNGFLVPSKERALIEYMMFADYFSEEFLIEGLQTYMDVYGSDLTKLWEVANLMKIRDDVVDKWITDAQESDRI